MPPCLPPKLTSSNLSILDFKSRFCCSHIFICSISNNIDLVWAKLALICPEKYFKPTSFELWSLGHLPICSCCFNIEEGAAVINNTGNTVLNFLGYYISWKCVLLINDKYWGQKKKSTKKADLSSCIRRFSRGSSFFFCLLWNEATKQKAMKEDYLLGMWLTYIDDPLFGGKKSLAKNSILFRALTIKCF